MDVPQETEATRPVRNGYAVASLSLGIAAVFLSFIGLIPILAIVFGGVGLRKVRALDGRGRVQSWIGLILGIIYTISEILISISATAPS